MSPHLQPVFCLIKLALGRMPIFIRRSRAGTLQITYTRSSKNGPMVTFASTHFYLVKGLARKVWRQCVLVFCAACDLRAPRRLLHGYETHPRAITFPPVSTITDGHAPAGSRRPDCTLSRLRAEEDDRRVTQLIAIPEPSLRTISTLDQALVACWSLECVTTLGSRRSCPG